MIIYPQEAFVVFYFSSLVFSIPKLNFYLDITDSL